ncbi:MAG: SH3 domain-containing protein [Lachnospiraceae bacterium]|nr:SH3 domain-containing protein [Lachnospiraceae bacterium]
MKRSIFVGPAAAILLICIAALFPTEANGATVSAGTVKVKSGNVRSSANTRSTVSFCVASGDEVAILGEEKGKDGNTWYKVSVGTSVGFIRSDLITKSDKKVKVNDSLVKNSQASSNVKSAAAAEVDKTSAKTAGDTAVGTAASGSTGTVKGTSVRMRKNASVTSGIVTTLNPGDKISIIAEGKATDGNVWYQVRMGDMTGFIRSDLVIKEKSAEPAAASTTAAVTTTETSSVSNKTGEGVVKGVNVRIRSSASTASDILASVNSGCKLKLTGVEKAPDRTWVKVETNVDGKNITGYIARDFITLTGVVNNDEPTKPVAAPAPKTTAVAGVRNDSDQASIKGVGVRIRQVPVDGDVVCQLSSGHPLKILGEKTGNDGHTWYQVSFSYLGSDREGFVRSDLVTRAEGAVGDAPVGSEDFERSIAELPEGYKNSLRAIHAKHPQWRFEAVNTNLEWSAALAAESSVGKNLVSKNSIASWKSTAPQAYNQTTNEWYTFDGGSWASASPELIAYYMDPRNFLNESGIYMFEKLDYSETQTTASVSTMLAGTFMSGDFIDTDGQNINYAELFKNVGSATGVSPYLIAGRALQEQGINGTSQSISGTVPGYEGYFNYFNVGAYAYGGRTAPINGLIYAMGSDENYGRPWNSRAKAIYGGAKYLADKYVLKGQNTLYFQKFNVVNYENTLYSHQYMSNIQAASSESSRLQLAYLGDDEVLTFRIPYYKNMPESACAKPVSDSNPNTYLASLSVSGYELMPAFSGVTENYVVTVDPGQETVEINASAVCPSSSVGGVGVFPIEPGTNTLYVGCKAQNGAVKAYTITVNR